MNNILKEIAKEYKGKHITIEALIITLPENSNIREAIAYLHDNGVVVDKTFTERYDEQPKAIEPKIVEAEVVEEVAKPKNIDVVEEVTRTIVKEGDTETYAKWVNKELVIEQSPYKYINKGNKERVIVLETKPYGNKIKKELVKEDIKPKGKSKKQPPLKTNLPKDNVDEIVPTVAELKEIETFVNDDYINKEISQNRSPDLVDTYYKDINQYKLLTAEEEKEIAFRVLDGDEEARQLLINSNLRLAHKVALNYYNTYFRFVDIQLLDLVQEANLGLIKAVDLFDPNLGFKFSTYAYWWIRQHITRAVDNYSANIRIPAHTRQQYRCIDKVRDMFQNEGETPTLEKVCDYINNSADSKRFSYPLTPSKILEIDKLTAKTISLNTPIGEEDDDTFLENVVASTSREALVEEVVEEKLQREFVIDLIDSCLSPKDALIVKLRFGLGTLGDVPMTLDEIGHIFDVSRERIRQACNKSYKKIKKRILTLCRLNKTTYKDLI